MTDKPKNGDGHMFICDYIVSREELKEIARSGFGDMVKGVVDTRRQLLALDAELHADLEALLLEKGSTQNALWGINLYPDETDDFVEFDSLINIRPMQGNRSRGVDDPTIRNEIMEVVSKWTEQ
jgi:hypothetical protein